MPKNHKRTSIYSCSICKEPATQTCKKCKEHICTNCMAGHLQDHKIGEINMASKLVPRKCNTGLGHQPPDRPLRWLFDADIKLLADKCTPLAGLQAS